tara:strand:- start:3711 stop:4781 length:1071 start_codon:yes stop_codon:yes gene_type:complete
MAGTTPFSPFSRAGFAAVTSPVRSHDVQALHEAVSKLQAQQVAQLELERQNQAVFDFVKAELGRVTQTISNLSSTVEDELRSLRLEATTAREASKTAKILAVQAASTTSRLSSESQLADSERQAVRAAITQLDEELRARKVELSELLGGERIPHPSATRSPDHHLAQRCGRLEDELGVLKSRFAQRLSDTENRYAGLAALVERIETWAVVAQREDAQRDEAQRDEAQRDQAQRDEAQRGAAAHECARSEDAELLRQLREVSAEVSAHGSELSRHRKAVVLMVESMDSLGIDQQTLSASLTPRIEELSRERAALSARIEQAVESSEQSSRRQAKETAALAEEVAALRADIRGTRRLY